MKSRICQKKRTDKFGFSAFYKLAKSFEASMEELLEPCFEQGSSFDLYKSNVCHKLKEKAYNDSIPEFIRFNIVENEVRDVL